MKSRLQSEGRLILDIQSEMGQYRQQRPHLQKSHLIGDYSLPLKGEVGGHHHHRRRVSLCASHSIQLNSDA